MDNNKIIKRGRESKGNQRDFINYNCDMTAKTNLEKTTGNIGLRKIMSLIKLIKDYQDVQKTEENEGWKIIRSKIKSLLQ